MRKMDVIIGGIEGGASCSKVVLLDASGEKLADAEGPSTNHWLIGLEEASKRIHYLVNEGKRKAGIDESKVLTSLGLSLSGCDSIEARQNLADAIKERYPNLTKHYFVGCDTVGPIATACVNGGLVLIAGTGSNCEVMHSDGSTERVGGWGHMVGDEASACWITHYCIKQLFDTEDNFYPSKHDVTFVKQTMYKHFQVSDRMGMLEHLYTKFDKTFFASMCKELARGAVELKDGLCLEAFHKAGQHLGRHVAALAPRIEKDILEAAEGGLRIVCVGSVWKSWPIMKDGFLEGITPTSQDKIQVKEFTLMELKKPATYGAAYLGAKRANVNIKVDSGANATAFFHHKL